MARALTGLLTAAACALALGCGGGDEASSTDANAPVTFQLAGNAEELAAYRDLVAGYERETGREVQLIEVPDRDAHLAKLVTAFGGGDPPDVFLINYRHFGAYARRGVVDPPGDRVQDSEFFAPPVEAFTIDGRLMCVPQNISSLVVYYNAELFEQAGLEPPAPDWTYDEFRDAARRLTGDGRHGVGVEPGIVRAAGFVWSAGGEVVDRTENPTRLTLDTPEARRGLQRLVDLGSSAPSAKEAASRSLEERFVDGSLGMFLSSRREVPAFRTIEGFRWDVAAFPRAELDHTVLHSDAYCVSRGGNTAAAHAFVEHAAGLTGQRLLARSGRTVPSRPAVARSPAFLDRTEPPRSSEVFLDAVPKIKRLPTDARWTEVEDLTDLALEQLFYGELTLDETLERIDRETTPLLAAE